jgi:L-lysine 2,3-aminomutase
MMGNLLTFRGSNMEEQQYETEVVKYYAHKMFWEEITTPIFLQFI